MNIRNILKISITLGIVAATYISIGNTFAENIINFSEYQKEVKTITIKNISKTKAFQEIMQAQNTPCEYIIEKKDMYIISPSCLLKNELPKIEFKEAIDYLWPYIDSFNMVYNDVSQTFSYQ
ncbi:MAG: hypothetical protein WCP92_00685 [bacterium]